MIECGDLPF